MLWRIGTGGLRILATCHTLQPSDYPISSVWDAAYEDTSRAIFEADARAPEVRGVGMSSGDDTLFCQDPELYRRVEAALADLGQDVSSLFHSKPWYAGLRLAVALIQREGFDYGYSLDNHLRQRAEADHKTVEFLEMPRDQFQCFELQPLATQINHLSLSLVRQEWIVQQIHRIVNGWRRSNEAELLSAQEDYLRLFPELYQCIIIGRNYRWLPRLEQIGREETPTLVCVGALHCVGQQGLPALLAARGLDALLEDSARA